MGLARHQQCTRSAMKNSSAYHRVIEFLQIVTKRTSHGKHIAHITCNEDMVCPTLWENITKHITMFVFIFCCCCFIDFVVVCFRFVPSYEH